MKKREAPPKFNARRAKRARKFRGRELERICNKAVLKFDGRLRRMPGAMFAEARQVAAEIRRTTARRYMIQAGTDEHDLLADCLQERTENYPRRTAERRAI